MMSDEEEFVIPQEDAEKLKATAYGASKIVFALIIISVFAIVGFAFYWTQIADRELPATIDVSVEEATL